MIEIITRYSTYIAVVLGLVTGYPLISTRGYLKQYSKFQVFALCVFFSLISVISVLLFASVEGVIGGKQFSIGAVSTYGLYIIAPVILLVVFHGGEKRKRIFDRYAFYVLPSMILQRIRCMIAGCCYGKHLFDTQLRWPTREMEILFYICMLCIFLKEEKDLVQGSLFPLLMISYSSFRFIEEFVRDGSGLLHMAHMWSVIVLIIGLSIYAEFRQFKKSRGY